MAPGHTQVALVAQVLPVQQEQVLAAVLRRGRNSVLAAEVVLVTQVPRQQVVAVARGVVELAARQCQRRVVVAVQSVLRHQELQAVRCQHCPIPHKRLNLVVVDQF